MEQISITQDRYDQLLKIEEAAAEFLKLRDIPGSARELMGNLSPKEITGQVNHRVMMMVNASLTLKDESDVDDVADMYATCSANIAIQLLFLADQVGFDLLAKINHLTSVSIAMAKAVAADQQENANATSEAN